MNKTCWLIFYMISRSCQKVHFPDSGLKPLSRSTNVPKVALIWRADSLYFKYNYKADDFVIEEAHEKTDRGPK